MTSDEIRLSNLQGLIAIAGGTPSTLEKYCAARGVKISWKYISQILTGFQGKKDRKPRTLGSDVARRLEGVFHRPPGWMDNDHSQSIGPTNDTVNNEAVVAPVDSPPLPPDELELLLHYRSLSAKTKRHALLDIKQRAEREALERDDAPPEPKRQAA